MHPLTTYFHYEKYAERIARGEKNVMTKSDILILGLTSGTTGKNKKYPVTRRMFMHMGLSCLALYYKQLGQFSKIGLKRFFQFRLFHPETRNEYGVLVGGAGNVFLRPSYLNVVPKCFLKAYKESASFFLQAVFALMDKDIGFLDGYSSDLWYCFFKFIVKNRHAICESIDKGELVSFDGLDESLRQEASRHLSPNKRRAQELRDILSGAPRGLVRRIWPGVELFSCAKVGGFAASAQLLKESYAEGVLMYYYAHCATEGAIGKTRTEVSYVMMTSSNGKIFLRYWPFVRAIHRSPHGSPMDSPHKGQWRFLWSAPKQTGEQTIEMTVIWDIIALIMTSL